MPPNHSEQRTKQGPLFFCFALPSYGEEKQRSLDNNENLNSPTVNWSKWSFNRTAIQGSGKLSSSILKINYDDQAISNTKKMSLLRIV
jgi:hypothetical protein